MSLSSNGKTWTRDSWHNIASSPVNVSLTLKDTLAAVDIEAALILRQTLIAPRRLRFGAGSR